MPTDGLPARVRILEVGPRDGLQNEEQPIPTERKRAFIEALVTSGLREVEVTSFVPAHIVPQLADADDLVRRLPAIPSVTFSAVVPNDHGLDRALAAGIRRIAVLFAATDRFSHENVHMPVAESLRALGPMVKRALDHGVTVRGYISASFVCPFEGDVAPEKVLDLAQRVLDLGADEVALSDTIGAAAPRDVQRLLEATLPRIPAERIALHLHDTYGTALANVFAGLQMGIHTFDTTAGGLGGCPFAPGAAGNLATEDLVYMLERMGIHTGVNLDGVLSAAHLIADLLARDLPGRQWRRWQASCPAPPSRY